MVKSSFAAVWAFTSIHASSNMSMLSLARTKRAPQRQHVTQSAPAELRIALSTLSQPRPQAVSRWCYTKCFGTTTSDFCRCTSYTLALKFPAIPLLKHSKASDWGFTLQQLVLPLLSLDRIRAQPGVIFQQSCCKVCNCPRSGVLLLCRELAPGWFSICRRSTITVDDGVWSGVRYGIQDVAAFRG